MYVDRVESTSTYNLLEFAIASCEFADNSIASRHEGLHEAAGAAVAVRAPNAVPASIGTISCSDSIFRTNVVWAVSKAAGGAIFADKGVVAKLERSNFHFNSAACVGFEADGSTVFGGAVRASEIQVASCVFDDNSARTASSLHGGAIAFSHGEFINSTFERNLVKGREAFGGALALTAESFGLAWGSLEVAHSHFHKNVASGRNYLDMLGGAISVVSQTCTRNGNIDENKFNSADHLII